MLLHHCSKFGAWTSVSSNSWNAQRQGGLSSDSNSSQPSWLRPSDTNTWCPSISGPDGISLFLLVTHWTQVPRKPVHMWKYVVHLDAHVAAQVSHSSQHVVDKFCVVFGLIVAKKVLHYQNKFLPRLQFDFVIWVFELWISEELPDMRTFKDTSFQLTHGQSSKNLAQVSETVTILVQSHGELRD